jgi:DNA-binding transcriptional MocR family regulator
MNTSWQPDLGSFTGPKYLALSRALREAVRSGSLAEGTRLPPVRDLAWTLGITPGTVARAYQIATQDGLLEATVGRGTFVAAARPRLGPATDLMHAPHAAATPRGLPKPGFIDLRPPQLPEVGQSDAIREAMAAIVSATTSHYLDYQSVRGDRHVRTAMATYLSDFGVGPADVDDMALTLGGQSAINIVLQCALRGDRPLIFAEELAYPGFRHAARLNRAEVVPIALDADGMRADALDRACRATRGRLVCVTTEAQNPTTVRMSPERRAEIVAVARAHDLQILEDDCFSAGSPGLPALRAVAPERTWLIASLSKSLAAGLRFGAVLCPPGLGEAARLAAQHGYFGVPGPVLDIVHSLLVSGRAAELRGLVQAEYDRRLGIALNVLGRFDVSWQKGLAFIWLRLPQGWRASSFTREAEARGILIRSADEYALVDGHAPNAVRIGLAGGPPEAAFAAAMRTLADLLDRPPNAAFD